MKITISGTEGTGKTTLVKAVSERYKIPMISEYAREIAKEMNILNLRQMSLEETYKFQNEVLKRKIEEESKHNSFIADRSTIDNLAYYLRWCGRDIRDELTQEYMNKCVKQLKLYDKVFVLPWNSVPHEVDGFRTTKLFYKYEMHCLIIGLLQENEIDFKFLNFTKFEDRVEYLGSYYEY